MTIAAEKEALVARLEAARRQLCAALEDINIHAEVYPGWQVKHLLAHIAGWDEACTSSLRTHAGGREPATPARYPSRRAKTCPTTASTPNSRNPAASSSPPSANCRRSASPSR